MTKKVFVKKDFHLENREIDSMLHKNIFRFRI